MNTNRMFRKACEIHTQFIVARYLMANTKGRQDGSEQATRHIELCNFYVAIAFGWRDPDTVQINKDGADELFQKIHKKTQDDLTDKMDVIIDFPLNSRPNYGKLGPLFFKAFHAIAMDSIETHFALASNQTTDL